MSDNLTTFKAQTMHNEPKNKGMMYNFGCKNLNPRANVEALPL